MSLLTIIMNNPGWHLLGSNKSSKVSQQSQKRMKQGAEPALFRFTFYGESPSGLKQGVKTLNSKQIKEQICQKQSSQQPNQCTEDALASFPLAIANPGDRLKILQLEGSEEMQRYLTSMGLVPGREIQVVSLTDAPSSAIVAIGDRQLGLGATQAQQIIVTKVNLMNSQPTKIEPDPGNPSDFHNQKPQLTKSLCLGDLAQGCKGRVMGYKEVTRGYKGKLLAMGLTPGTEFAITRYAPLGDPVEIRVRGFSLSLRKHEANALLVEEVCE